MKVVNTYQQQGQGQSSWSELSPCPVRTKMWLQFIFWTHLLGNKIIKVLSKIIWCSNVTIQYSSKQKCCLRNPIQPQMQILQRVVRKEGWTFAIWSPGWEPPSWGLSESLPPGPALQSDRLWSQSGWFQRSLGSGRLCQSHCPCQSLLGMRLRLRHLRYKLFS